MFCQKVKSPLESFMMNLSALESDCSNIAYAAYLLHVIARLIDPKLDNVTIYSMHTELDQV